MWGVALLILVLGLVNTHGAQSVQLGWDASQDPAITGYHVYYGTACREYANQVDVGTNTTVTISGLCAGETYYFAVTAYNSAGEESNYSGEIAYITPGVLDMVSSTNLNSASMEFPVAPGHWYEIQASEDLQTWTTIGQTGVATSNVWEQFSDPEAGHYPKRFYRLILH